ncbi:MAG: hypothetical protein JW795_08325 [Chitinivibrionales bacterium]|nr:hypothetical protein [Chitinivibrionales bacterium]
MEITPIRYLSATTVTDSQSLEKLLHRNSGTKLPIDSTNWPAFQAAVLACCSLWWHNDGLFLRFTVTEPTVAGRHGNDGDVVFEDSCVEFFCSFSPQGGYYNFEFNCIGACLAAYGTSRHDRVKFSAQELRSLIRWSSLGTDRFDEQTPPIPVTWILAAYIPTCLFKYEQLESGDQTPFILGRRLYANMYKCGDRLSQKHYLSWQKIATEKPDFHRPEFFGTLELSE